MKSKHYSYIEQLIAKKIANLPKDELMALARNEDQIKVWLLQRNFYLLVAQCWHAKYSGQDDPIECLLAEKKISQLDYDRIWLCFDWYDSLWGLIQRLDPIFKSLLENQGAESFYSSALELFLSVVSAQANEEYSMQLEGYLELSSRKIAKGGKLAAKSLRGEEMTKGEQIAISNFNPVGARQKESLLTIVVAAASAFASDPNNKALKAAYEDYCHAYARLITFLGTQARKLPSVVVEYGKVTKRGGAPGGTYA